MHPNAANSLLKVIEEPQSEVYIFFLTSDEEKILPTIRSRTQIFHFKTRREADLAWRTKWDWLRKSDSPS